MDRNKREENIEPCALVKMAPKRELKQSEEKRVQKKIYNDRHYSKRKVDSIKTKKKNTQSREYKERQRKTNPKWLEIQKLQKRKQRAKRRANQNALQDFIVNANTDTKSTVSGIRVGSPTPSMEVDEDDDDEENSTKLSDVENDNHSNSDGDNKTSSESNQDSDKDDDSDNHQKSKKKKKKNRNKVRSFGLTVEDFYNPQQAVDFATEIMNKDNTTTSIAGITDPKQLKADYEHLRYIIANDHCYTPYTYANLQNEEKSVELSDGGKRDAKNKSKLVTSSSTMGPTSTVQSITNKKNARNSVENRRRSTVEFSDDALTPNRKKTRKLPKKQTTVVASISGTVKSPPTISTIAKSLVNTPTMKSASIVTSTPRITKKLQNPTKLLGVQKAANCTISLASEQDKQLDLIDSVLQEDLSRIKTAADALSQPNVSETIVPATIPNIEKMPETSDAPTPMQTAELAKQAPSISSTPIQTLAIDHKSDEPIRTTTATTKMDVDEPKTPGNVAAKLAAPITPATAAKEGVKYAKRSDGLFIPLPPIEATTTQSIKSPASANTPKTKPNGSRKRRASVAIKRSSIESKPRRSMSISNPPPDDPYRLWCICRTPHNNSFMVSCNKCAEWFHGKCVGVTRQMEKGQWICLNCDKKQQTEIDEMALINVKTDEIVLDAPVSHSELAMLKLYTKVSDQRVLDLQMKIVFGATNINKKHQK